ncbi:unnamed protein product [Rhodiola kirilowii]
MTAAIPPASTTASPPPPLEAPPPKRNCTQLAQQPATENQGTIDNPAINHQPLAMAQRHHPASSDTT